MDGLSTTRMGGLALIVGGVGSLLFFLIRPGGILVDTAEAGDTVAILTAYSANPELTRVSSIFVALGLILFFTGMASVWRAVRESGKSDTLVAGGVLFALVGVSCWVVTQGIILTLADVSPESINDLALGGNSASIVAGTTYAGGLAVSVGFLLFSLGVSTRGGLYRSTGLIIAAISLIALAGFLASIFTPDNPEAGIAIARLCYFPWVIWAAGLGVGMLREPSEG